ncbi:MAG: type II secretion system F family protein [Paraglaciecola sp.]|nr:type II secretion system F family protein [Paraglaciecola sp.]NCT49081.1 type II secretion system F family protein [Paraglaciecola sp.]
MKFKYSGFELATKQATNGEVEAASEQEALRLLTQRRIEVYTIDEPTNSSHKGRKVTVSDLVIPLQELSTLCASGVSLIDALKALAQNKEHPALANGFKKIASRIEGGESLSTALQTSGLPFPRYVGHLVNAGELGGQLPLALANASEQLNYDQAIKSDLRSALTYPVVLVGAGIAAMLIIFFAVVPKFSHLLNGDKPLPALATFVLTAGKLVNESPYLVLTCILGVIFSLVVIFTNPTVKHWLMDKMIEVPVIGPWLAEQDAARWSSLCSAMLHAKVNLVVALRLAAESCDYTRRRIRAQAMVVEVESGVAFTQALERSALVPQTSLNLVAVGDKTGQLAQMLSAVAKLHDNACKRRMKQVLTLMEPLAILVVGVLIGVMILGIVMAITASTDIEI